MNSGRGGPTLWGHTSSGFGLHPISGGVGVVVVDVGLDSPRPPCARPPDTGPPSAGPPKFSLFFPLPPQFRSFCVLRPRRFTHHQNSTRRHQRDTKRAKWWWEREKKREIWGLPPFGAPPIGAPFFWVWGPPFAAPKSFRSSMFFFHLVFAVF